MARDCLHTAMWFPLRANVVAFRSLKQALFKVLAASAEPRRQKKTKIAQGSASQHSTAPRQNRHFHPILACLRLPSPWRAESFHDSPPSTILRMYRYTPSLAPTPTDRRFRNDNRLIDA